MNRFDRPVTRRQALRTAGLALVVPGAAAALEPPVALAARRRARAALTPEMTEGPYWVNTMLHRSDVRANTDGSDRQAGVPLRLYIHVHDRSGQPMNGLAVDIWHANADGLYSDESTQSPEAGVSTSAEDTISDNFLRGYQLTGHDAGLADEPVDGQVSFHTIWPGWYTGRAIHIHVRVRKLHSSGATIAGYTTQLFFSDADNDRVLTGATPYSARSTQEDPTTDETDTILTTAARATNIVAVEGNLSHGYTTHFHIVADRVEVHAHGSLARPSTGGGAGGGGGGTPPSS